MQVLISDAYLDSALAMEQAEQVRALEFMREFRRDPKGPGMSLERVRNTKSDGVWSGRVSQDLRAIAWKDGDTWALLHVGHHDAAYDWAERRAIGRHSVTGELQVVEVQESVREVERVLVKDAGAPPLNLDRSNEYLLSLGVPEEWLPLVREVRDADQLCEVCVELPPEVGDRLVQLASGDLVTPPAPVPLDQPLALNAGLRRSFLVSPDDELLERVLAAPRERWLAFLHPSQEDWVARDFRGPAKVSGSAGTGKTVVAMHRARRLAAEGKRVLFATYVRTLRDNIAGNLRLLCSPEELKLITVATLHEQALSLAQQSRPGLAPDTQDLAEELLEREMQRQSTGLQADFLRAEWEMVVDAQGLRSWTEYRAARRTGRGTPLTVRQRKEVWAIFEPVIAELDSRDRSTWKSLARLAADALDAGDAASPFDSVIVDELQDLGPPELRLLRSLSASDPGCLFLVGDAGQRIYPGGFSLFTLGLDVRGRSHVLRVNYRTTEQIRRQADRVLGEEVDDFDDGRESRRGTRSLVRGPEPALEGFPTLAEERAGAVRRIRQWVEAGIPATEIGVFARTGKRVGETAAALREAGVPARELADASDGVEGVAVGTMHRAKGLEFRAVLVLDASASSLPSQSMLKHYPDPADREAATESDRRLLYVAMTRARQELAVTWPGQPSTFLAPLLGTRTSGEGA